MDDCRYPVFLPVHQNNSRRHGSFGYHDQRSEFEKQRCEREQYAVERRRKDGAAFRGRSRVGRSRVHRSVENDNSGCVGGKEFDQDGGVEKL
ncbi:hypothetical protein A2U01_0069206, partial [Trifolium medium]|nr:hypothetical protein [Trifolium medium]